MTMMTMMTNMVINDNYKVRPNFNVQPGSRCLIFLFSIFRMGWVYTSDF